MAKISVLILIRILLEDWIVLSYTAIGMGPDFPCKAVVNLPVWHFANGPCILLRIFERNGVTSSIHDSSCHYIPA